MKIIEKANLTMENALFGEKVFRANKTKVSNFESEVVTDEWKANDTYNVESSKDFISKMDITLNVDVIKKGDILNIDMNGDGTTEKYLVLRSKAGIVEVISREVPTGGYGVRFDENGSNVYAGKTLDTFLNETYYATLSATAKSAIVGKTFKQDSWYRDDSGNPDYIGKTTTQFTFSLSSATFGEEITRNIFALSVQDIVDYIGLTPEMTADNTTWTSANIKVIYPDVQGGTTYSLRSAFAGNSAYVIALDATSSIIDSYSAMSGNRILPAFQLDLTKIEWSKDNA